MELHCLNESTNRCGRLDKKVEDVLGAEGLVDAEFHFLTQSLYSVENMAGLGRSPLKNTASSSSVGTIMSRKRLTNLVGRRYKDLLLVCELDCRQTWSPSLQLHVRGTHHRE